MGLCSRFAVLFAGYPSLGHGTEIGSELRILGKIALAVVVIISSLLFLLFSFCAVSGGARDVGMNGRDREIAAAIAFANAGAIALGVWGLARLSRKK